MGYVPLSWPHPESDRARDLRRSWGPYPHAHLPFKKTACGTCGFFEHWRAALKWQRLRPYEKFAAMIDRHWEGIAAYCHPENKVALGFVEGLNNKVRVLQRRAYGLRDEEYLRLKILTCTLPAL